ncbi:hypothetical protein D3C73_537160 [compost metagenome]
MKPVISVIAVTNTADETAGSVPALSSSSGIIMPAIAAANMFIIIADAITIPR